MIDTVLSAMEWAAFALDVLAVLIILTGVVVAAFRCRLLRTLLSPESAGTVPGFKHQLVSNLLLALDLLIASDVISTVAVELTLDSVATLGLLVVVRVVLTWSLIVEMEGRWPWQPRPAVGEGDANPE